MKTYCFKITTTDLNSSIKLLNNHQFKKRIKINTPFVYIKNNFLFFKANPEELNTDLKRIIFLNDNIFYFKELDDFYERRNNFLIQKNLFFDLPNLIFISNKAWRERLEIHMLI